MTQSLQKSNLPQRLSGNITVFNAVKNQALISYNEDEKQIIFKAIKKETAKMFFFHCGGDKPNKFDIDRNELFSELLIDIYEYETPETIILFLRKATKGDFGKFYGKPDIGTIREWFATFLQTSIIPERERLNTAPRDHDNRGQDRSLKEYIQGSRKTGAINIPDRFKG